MIAITDISAYTDLDTVVTNNAILIPTQTEIQTLIGSSEFINAAITTAFKALLVKISNETYVVGTGFFLQPQELVEKISNMFNTIGFYHNNGIINFQINTDAFDIGTAMIINHLNTYNKKTEFQKIAYEAFHDSDNSWAKEANNIRAMENTGLQKLYYITVFSNSNSDDSLNFTTDINNPENILNRRNESTQRFLMINLNQNADPVMPTVRIMNNSNTTIKLRVIIEYKNYVNPDTEGEMGGAFGPAIPYDNNLDGTIGNNERVHLNRHFLNYFPNEANSNNNELGIFTVNIAPQGYWDVLYDNKIRGGEVKIEFVKGSETWAQGELHDFIFHIRGKNPSYQQVLNYVTTQQYLNRFWFMIRKLRQESGSNANFNGINPTNNNYEFRHFDRVSSINQFNLRKNSDNGLPVFGFPRGYGISQLDNFGQLLNTEIENLGLTSELAEIQVGGNRELQTIVDQQTRTIDFSRRLVASDQEVWHWQENIDKGVWFLENEKMNMTISKINTIRNRVISWNNSHPTDLVVVPTPEYYDSVIYCWTASEIAEFANYNDLFQEGIPPNIINQGTRELKSFFDAMLLKTYNGLGYPNPRHFLEINVASSDPTIKPILTIYNSTPQNPYYVRNLSNRSD